MPKKEVPKAPFFLFDIDKVILENDATPDLLKEQLFQRKKQESASSEKKTSNLQATHKLKQLLK